MSRDGQPDKAPVPNHALAARMREKGFSETRLATAAGVDIKTVGRWVRGESLPQAVNARAAADALGCAIGTVRSRLHRARTMLASRMTALQDAQARVAEASHTGEPTLPLQKRCMA